MRRRAKLTRRFKTYMVCQMRISPLKHTLAVLRFGIGPEMTQKQMAVLLNRSTVTIQKIELNKLPLAESLAQEISRQTGIGLAWLLANKPAVPPVNLFDLRYSRSDFEAAQAGLRMKFGQGENHFVWTYIHLWEHVAGYCGIAASALERGSFHLFEYKLSHFLGELVGEFGEKKGDFERAIGAIPKHDAPAVLKRKMHAVMEKLFEVADRVAPTPKPLPQRASVQPSRPARRKRA